MTHRQFVEYFASLFMGTANRKMLVAYLAFVCSGNEPLPNLCEGISAEKVRFFLESVPVTSKSEDFSENGIGRLQLETQKARDSRQISSLIELIFNEQSTISLNEFSRIATTVTGDLYFSFFHQTYLSVPCARDFFLLRKIFSDHQDAYSPSHSDVEAMHISAPKTEKLF